MAKYMSFQVEKDFALRIRIEAARRNISRSEFIRNAIEKEMNEGGGDKKKEE